MVATRTNEVVRPANVPVEIVLQRGEVVQIFPKWSPDRNREITGTLIEANHPVAVFSGHNCAYVPDVTVKACNTLVEQMPPTSTWGSRFVVAPPKGRSSAVVRVLADHDSTAVSLNGSVVATIGRGEWYENTELREPAMISTSQPTLVALFTAGFDNGDNVGDPSMTVVPPLHQHALGYRLVAEPLRGSWHNILALTVPEEGLSSLRLNDAPLQASTLKRIAGSNYVVVQLEIPHDARTVACDKPFGALQFGIGYDEFAYDAYGFAYGYPIADPTLAAEEQQILDHSADPALEPPHPTIVSPPAHAPAASDAGGAKPPKVE